MNQPDVFLVGNQIITLFLIIFIGIYAKKIKIINDDSSKALSSLLLNVTQPFMIITSFQMEYDKNKLFTGIFIVIMSVLIHIFVSVIAYFSYKSQKNRGAANVYEIATIFSNCAFLGYPVLKVVFGENLGIFYGAFYTIFFNIYIWTYGLRILARGNNAQNKVNIIKILVNPGIISSVIGIIIFITGFRLPEIIYNSAKMVGDVTFPLSMIIVGSLISDLDFGKLFFSLSNYWYLIVKLFLIPSILLAIFIIIKLDKTLAYVGVLMSCMPTAANVAMFAQTGGADGKLAGRAVGLSTLFSVFSIPLFIFILNKFLL